MSLVIVQHHRSRILLCDRDLLRMLNKSKKQFSNLDNSQTSLIESKDYTKLLLNEYRLRFKKDYPFDFVSSWKNLEVRNNSKPKSVTKISEGDYYEQLMSLKRLDNIEWSDTKAIPKCWKRIISKGRLYCPLPVRLTSQVAIPVESTKKEKVKTAAAIHKEYAYLAKSVGTKPLTPMEVETALINGESIEELTISKMKEKNNYAKGVQFLVEREEDVKLYVKDIRKWVKEDTLEENLGSNVIHAEKVQEIFDKYGLE